MSNDSFVFHFDLRESLYLEGSQGISEIINIALDPEISIQAFNDYYSIRGVISLNGEYVQTEENQEEQSASLHSYDYKRYMEKNEDVGEGMGEFAHRFPVEISVPSYRVADVDDVKVSIASFDYELPSSQKLVIHATIGIQGIADDSAVSTREESLEVEPISIDKGNSMKEVAGKELDKMEEEGEEEGQDTFEFEILRKKTDEKEREEVKTMDSTETTQLESEKENREDTKETKDVEETKETDEESEEDRLLFKKKTQSLQEFFATKQNKQPKEDASSDEQEATSEQQTKTVSDENVVEEFEENEENREQEEEMDVSFLSEMIRNEEETYSQMRLCIVQKEDTLESIAERYKTTTLHIIKRNHLEDDTLSEGQLLYVPKKKKQK